jgi:hypothetical protein
MTEALIILLYFAVQDVVETAVLISIFSTLAYTVWWVFALVSKDDDTPVPTPSSKGWTANRVAWIFLPIWLLAAAIPDTEDLKYIIGGAVAWNVAQTEEAQRLPENVLRAANSFLEKIDAEAPKETQQ